MNSPEDPKETGNPELIDKNVGGLPEGKPGIPAPAD